jgi:hypothetical protein
MLIVLDSRPGGRGECECEWKGWVGRFAKEGLDLNY